MISEAAEFSAKNLHVYTGRGRRSGHKARPRVCSSVEGQYRALGGVYFCRAYWMHYESFLWLFHKLEVGIKEAWLKKGGHEKKGGRKNGNNSLPPVPNGEIKGSVHLARGLWYFVGGSPYDIMEKYGISHTNVMDSVWHIIEAVNILSEFKIEYPESAEEQ